MAPILEPMGAKGAKKVDLERLAAAVPDYPFAYLITVDDGYRVHTVTVEPVLRDLARKDNPGAPRTVIDIGLIGERTRTNLANRNEVTLLWPPPEPGGYSLIVDGRTELFDPEDISDEIGPCAVVPTRALLHRNSGSPAAAKGCLHDCIVFSLPA